MAVSKADLVRNQNHLTIASERDVISARQMGRTFAAEIGFAPRERAMIAAVIYELARNILEHARQGEIRLDSCEDGDRRGIVLVAHDDGPGIPGVNNVLRMGYAVTSLGLRGIGVLMDDLNIASNSHQGTTVTVRKWRT